MLIKKDRASKLGTQSFRAGRGGEEEDRWELTGNVSEKEVTERPIKVTCSISTWHRVKRDDEMLKSMMTSNSYSFSKPFAVV